VDIDKNAPQPPPLLVVGVSHKVAPLSLREQLRFPSPRITAILLKLAERLSGEVLILSTCNRFEVYAACSQHGDARDTVLAYLSAREGIERDVLEKFAYSHWDHVAVRHLFAVAAGLDSMLVGEPQILGQVRKAFFLARECGTAGPGLTRLFQSALRVGKLVRTHTDIGRYHLSLGQATVALAKTFFNGRGLSPENVLIIGAGEIAEWVAKALTINGLGPVLVANRSFERARALAEALHGEALRFDRLTEALTRADVVISSTSAPHHVLHRADVERVLTRRGGRPLCLIDIAVPRDIDPAVTNLPGVRLYNIDDLQHVRDENLRRRQREADRAARLVAEEASRFMHVWNSLVAVPVVRRLRQRAEEIRQAEVERALRQMPELSAREREIIEAMTKAMVNKTLHPTLVQLREPAGGPPCAGYLHCVAGFLGVGRANGRISEWANQVTRNTEREKRES